MFKVYFINHEGVPDYLACADQARAEQTAQELREDGLEVTSISGPRCSPIDQAERKRLCRALVSGHPAALQALACLYTACGYQTLAKVLLASSDGGRTHAETILRP